MSKLLNMRAAFEMTEAMYGVTPNTDTFEDVALIAWEKIGNKHTRLYQYIGDTENHELKLPCNVDIIESVHIPLTEGQTTHVAIDGFNWESIAIEKYIDSQKRLIDPYDGGGKLVRYKEGDGVLYFSRDYKNVKVVYHGIFVDDTGLPLVNEKELKAISSFVAWRELLKDGIKKRNKDSINIAQMIEGEWLKNCTAARVKEYLSQNDMDAVLDAKYRWDRKLFHRSTFPTI